MPESRFAPMRRLMLLRHAKTETDAPSGRTRTAVSTTVAGATPPKSAAGSAGIRPFPTACWFRPRSGRIRPGRSAWEAMKNLVSQPQVEFLPELYGAGSDAPACRPSAWRPSSDPKRLMLVGHNPGMHELALTLTGSGDAAGKKALDRQSADLGPCHLRLRDRRLERGGVPPRQARAVRQPETAEADVGRLTQRTSRRYAIG